VARNGAMPVMRTSFAGSLCGYRLPLMQPGGGVASVGVASLSPSILS
jgi:hypothetical protein